MAAKKEPNYRREGQEKMTTAMAAFQKRRKMDTRSPEESEMGTLGGQ